MLGLDQAMEGRLAWANSRTGQSTAKLPASLTYLAQEKVQSNQSTTKACLAV